MSTSLTFQDHSLEIIKRKGSDWIRITQIGLALGYKHPETALTKIYNQHKDEFSSSMVEKIRIQTPGGEQEVLAFSLRGAHLLAMFSRTPIAAQFRHWVLDVLETSSKPEEVHLTANQAIKRVEKTHGDIVKASEVLAHLATGKRPMPHELQEWLSQQLLRRITLSCATIELMTFRA